MNKCENCVRKANQAPPTECPNCKKLTLMADCCGPTLVFQCGDCGWSIAGSSFWAPCEEDSIQYTVTISRVGKESFVRIAGWLGINVVQLYKELSSSEYYSKKCEINQLLDLIRLAKENDMDYTFSPDPFAEYPELMDCPLRMKIEKV